MISGLRFSTFKNAPLDQGAGVSSWSKPAWLGTDQVWFKDTSPWHFLCTLIKLCPQHCLPSPCPVFSAAAFNSLPSCKEKRAQDYFETKDKETLLAQLFFFFLLQQLLLSFCEFINYNIAVWLLNITMNFWLLKESRKLLWDKIFIVVYLLEFVSR